MRAFFRSVWRPGVTADWARQRRAVQPGDEPSEARGRRSYVAATQGAMLRFILAWRASQVIATIVGQTETTGMDIRALTAADEAALEAFLVEPRWTPQIRPDVDRSKPAS